VDVYVASIAALRAWPGIVIEAERRAVSSPGKTWVYQMDFGTPTAEGRAPLTLDAAFLFDNLALVPGMIGAHEAEIAAAQPLASQMADSLIAFARTGDPNCKGLPKWPSYDLKDRQTMVFDRATQVVSDPRSEERQLAAREHYRQPGT
jgi:para-nitrobenzyl esterase